MGVKKTVVSDQWSDTDQDQKQRALYELEKRFREATDLRDVEQLGEHLGCLVFGG